MKFPLPSPLFYLLPLAGYWLVLIYYLGAQWSVYEQYNYGWAVPFLCLYLIWRRCARGNAETLKAETLKSLAPGAGEEQKAESAGGKAEKLKSRNAEIPVPFSFSAFQLFSFCFLCLLYAPTRFLHEANPTWRLTSLLWTLEVIALTLLSIHLALGATPALRDLGTRPSRTQFQLSAFSFSDFVFPICFFLVAVPWPSGLENFLTQSLMRLNTATTVELLGFLGIPAVQQGNAIEVGTGVVGIDEACSGIRSLQAALMLSLFLGELNRLSAKRRVFCVFAGFVLAFIFNVGRTLLLTRIAAAKGLAAVASWHDPVGVAILVGCFLCLWLIARGLRGNAETLKAEMLKSAGQRAESGGGNAETLKAEMLKSAGQRAESGGGNAETLKAEMLKSAGQRAESGEGNAETLKAEMLKSAGQRAESGGGNAETLKAEMLKLAGQRAESGEGNAETLKAEMLKSGNTETQDGFSVSAFQRFSVCLAGFSVSAFQRFSIFLLAWLLVVEGGTAFWYRSHEHGTAGTKQWSVNLELPQAAVARTDLPAHIRDQFQADDSLQLRWRDTSGNDWLLYYFRWLTPHSLKGRVAVQLAKVHGPEVCLPAAGMTLESSLGVVTVPLGGTVLALQQYRFRAEGRRIHIFYGVYEDANGSTVLTDRRQSAGSRIKAALAGNRSSGQRFLELALAGPEQPEDARAALTRELGQLIKLEKTTDHGTAD